MYSLSHAVFEITSSHIDKMLGVEDNKAKYELGERLGNHIIIYMHSIQ